MQRMLYIESAAQGALMVNGQFCGPLEGEGQAFPAGEHAEIYIQFFPFSPELLPVSAALLLHGGEIARLEPQDGVYALLWPDGVIQLELRPHTLSGADVPPPDAPGETVAGTLLRYLSARLAGDPQADALLMGPQAGADVSGYDAVVPLRFAPLAAGSRFDERAGLVMRLAPNIARVDAALASTVPAGQGKRRIERIEILRTGRNA